MTTGKDELNQEIELKLQLLTKTTGGSLWNLPFVRVGLIGLPEEYNLVSVYYDTSDHHLLKQGYTLRMRKNNDAHTLTVKKMGDVAGGLHQRGEWNYPSPSVEPSVDYIEDQALRECLENILKDKMLKALMTTTFKRTQSNWQDEDGNLMEIAIDEGLIETDQGKENIREVELELKKGQTTALLTMGEQLALAFPMNASNESKFYRGLKQLGLQNDRVLPRETHETRFQLPLKDNDLGKVIPRLLEESFYHVLMHYHRLFQQEINEEEVHQIRVSSRHARSLLVFFKPVLTKETHKPLEKEFKSFAKNFAKLREVQVMKYHLQQSPCVAFCGQLEEIINEEVNKELQALEKNMKSGSMTPLLLRLWRMVTEIQVKQSHKNDPVSLFAEERLTVWLDKCNQRHVKLSQKDMKYLHQQRIRVKRIRYAAEWLGPVLPKKAIKTSKKLKEQQELMGELHDIHWEKLKLREWIDQRESSVDTMYQLGFYEGWQEKRKHHLWETLLNK